MFILLHTLIKVVDVSFALFLCSCLFPAFLECRCDAWNWSSLLGLHMLCFAPLKATIWAYPVAQQVKNQPALQESQEMQVWSLGGKNPLEEGMASHSSILAWRIPWTEESGGLQSTGLQRVGHDWSDFAYMHAFTNLIVTICYSSNNVSP